MTVTIKGKTTIKAATTVGFSPLLVSGLVLWLDASDSTTITQSGGAVSQWNDKSGNANNATQATGSAQPTVQTAAQNGLNTLRFTASSSQRLLLASSITPATACTAITVVRRGGPSGSNNVQVIGSTTDSEIYCVEWFSTLRVYQKFNGILSYTPNNLNQTGYHCVTSGVSGAATGNYIRFNAVEQTLTQQSLTGGKTFNCIGYSDTLYSNGEIAEICFYNRLLSAAEAAMVEAYLKTKWATP